MPRVRSDLYEIADYIGSMLEELIKLSRPLQNTQLTSLLSISAELARGFDAVKDKKSDTKPRAEIVPMRLKPDRPATKSKRVIRSAR
jgi:hypothetical protein